MFKDMRVRFCKQGSAVYFSHLDLNRAVMRAMRRSGVAYWSTGGFSPHPYCVFAQPLPLGYESRGELFDFRLLEDAPQETDALRTAFPDSLRILEIYSPEAPFKHIAFADYEMDLKTDAGASVIEAAFSGPLPVLKKTKRSESEVDLRDYIRSISVSPRSNGVRLSAVIATGNERNLSSQYLAEGLCRAGILCETQRVVRRGFLKADGTVFR